MMPTLKELREDRLLTQKELADKVGISTGAIYKMESGKTKRPQFRVLRKLAEALGVEPQQIEFGGKTEAAA